MTTLLQHSPRGLVLALALAALVTHTRPASAQCPWQWYPTDGVAGPDPAVYAMTLWDPDGAGPQAPLVVVGGEFTSAGPIPAANIAAWDGANWAALGTGMNGGVNSLAVMQDGRLVAGGAFTTAGGVTVNYIAAWDGSTWAPVGPGPTYGMNNTVQAVAVRTNGDLIVGGSFSSVGGVTVRRIARWNGSTWSDIGNMNATVWCLCAMPNGDVVAGGQFTNTTGQPGKYLARWNGSTWAAMANLNQLVLSANLDADSNLIVGGQFTLCSVPANHIARLTGTTWSAFGSGILGPVWAAKSLPNGDIVAGGTFFTAGGHTIESIALWNGSDWSALDGGVSKFPDYVASNVLALCSLPNGDLMAGGVFTLAGGQATHNVARWAPGAAPAITQQPQSASVAAGGNAGFSVAATGAGTLSYQWRKDGSPLSDGPTGNGSTIAGATTDTLAITAVANADAGAYDCVVSSECGSVTSDAAMLTVTGGCEPCDLNCDGTVNPFDINGFLSALSGGATCSPCAGDANADGTVNPFDINAFLACLGG